MRKIYVSQLTADAGTGRVARCFRCDLALALWSRSSRIRIRARFVVSDNTRDRRKNYAARIGTNRHSERRDAIIARAGRAVAREHPLH
jgi:hypothetical protein